MNILVEKGFLKRAKSGKRYLYSPTISEKKAGRTAMENLLNTYFDNSLEKAVTALLEIRNKRIQDQDLEKLSAVIDKARRKEEKND